MAIATDKQKEAINTFLLVVGYAVFFYCFQFFANRAGLLKVMPDVENLLHWDASWYKSVATSGYEFHEHSSTSGFFYLFPAIWKLIGVNVWGIVILNIFFFAAGFSILTSLFKLSITDKVLWLSIPTVYFAFVPYTEALFFLLGSLLLYGISNKNNKLVIVSLFLLSLTRVTVVFLVPGLLMMSLISNERKDWAKSTLRFLWLYLLPALLGLGVFILYQYWQTGVWFAYFIQQSTYWGHKFYGLPQLPFLCIGGNGTVGMAAIGVFIDLLALGSMVYMGLRWLINNQKPENKLLTMSVVYLFLVLYFTVFYNPAYDGDNTRTNSTGVFRYSMMSPFFYVFLNHFTTNRKHKWQHYLLVFLVANVAYLSFGSYLHLQNFLFYNTNTLLIFLHMHYGKSKNNFGIIAIAINFFLQVHMFQLFIDNGIYPD